MMILYVCAFFFLTVNFVCLCVHVYVTVVSWWSVRPNGFVLQDRYVEMKCAMIRTPRFWNKDVRV